MQVGNTIVCINNKTSKPSKSKICLTLNKPYKVLISNLVKKSVLIKNDKDEYSSYNMRRFITLSEYRELQLNKIL
jgi:hypothetical protein